MYVGSTADFLTFDNIDNVFLSFCYKYFLKRNSYSINFAVSQFFNAFPYLIYRNINTLEL